MEEPERLSPVKYQTQHLGLLVRCAVIRPLAFDAMLDDPRMVLHVRKRDTLLWVQDKQLYGVSGWQ